MRSALFTGFQNFTPCEKPVKKYMKTNSSHVCSQDNSPVCHRFFTGFHPIVNVEQTNSTGILLRAVCSRTVYSFVFADCANKQIISTAGNNNSQGILRKGLFIFSLAAKTANESRLL